MECATSLSSHCKGPLSALMSLVEQEPPPSSGLTILSLSFASQVLSWNVVDTLVLVPVSVTTAALHMDETLMWCTDTHTEKKITHAHKIN